MISGPPIRFIGKDKSQFYATLKGRIDRYFSDNHLSKYANSAQVIKTVVLLSIYILPFVALLSFQPSFGWSLLLWAVMGVGLAGVGMGIMHDANHSAYSANTRLNEVIGASLNLLGASVFNWKLQHNTLHHTFTNIAHYDDDIADKGLLRLSPHTPVKPVYRFQWLLALPVYGIVTLYWVTAKDFLQFARYTRNGVNKNAPHQNLIALAKIILVKILYFGVFLGAPALVGVPLGQVAAGFLLMHFIGGLILTVIFQLAHSVEETTFPQPDDEGRIENDWALHQMETTVNFCPKNRLLGWYAGGLNFQIEHHLFPRIAHIHYPKIAAIVRHTAEEFNVPYLEHKSFLLALRSHFATLRRFGTIPEIG